MARTYYNDRAYKSDRDFLRPGFSVIVGSHAGHITAVGPTRQYDLKFKERLTREKAVEEGDIVCSLMWNSADDLDLHCLTPYGKEISWRNRRNAGGELDVDMNAPGSGPHYDPQTPVENIVFRTAPEGGFRFFVKKYKQRSALKYTAFTVRLKIQDTTWFFDGHCGWGELPVTAFDVSYVWDPTATTNRADFDFGEGKREVARWKTGEKRCKVCKTEWMSGPGD